MNDVGFVMTTEQAEAAASNLLDYVRNVTLETQYGQVLGLSRWDTQEAANAWGELQKAATAFPDRTSMDISVTISDAPEKHRCPFCHSNAPDDSRGNCSACGGTRE